MSRKQSSADRSRVWKLGQILARIQLSKDLREPRRREELALLRYEFAALSRGLSDRHRGFADLVCNQLEAVAHSCSEGT